MIVTLVFILNSILLGVGLAMDAFSVSLVGGLQEPDMRAGRMNLIAGVFGFFQAAMPMLGWLCVHEITVFFAGFERLIPWIALILLVYIGGKMLIESIRDNDRDVTQNPMTFTTIIIQGIATSIDALSVGFTISQYGLAMALLASMIIAAVTYVICVAGIIIGKKFGTRLAGKAGVLGGIILIAIGIEIFVKGIIQNSL